MSAAGGTRTPTGVTPLGPKPSVTANSTTAASRPAMLLAGRRVSDAEVLDDLGDMAGRLDVVQGALDLALLVDDHRRTDDTGHRLAVQLLLAEGAVRLQGV